MYLHESSTIQAQREQQEVTVNKSAPAHISDANLLLHVQHAQYNLIQWQTGNK